MASFPPVPVTLIAGFLGSGKTTLLNRLLGGDHGRRIAVLVNDFGDVSIDAALVESADETTITLANGCICCSIASDLIGAVRDLLRRDPPPEQLVVEMSGIADPGSVLRTFTVMEKTWPLHIDAVIALVDAEYFPNPGEQHYTLAREQLVLANVVLINKTDLVGPGAVRELRARIQSYVPTARILESVQAEVPLELLLGAASERTALNTEKAPAAVDFHGFQTVTYRDGMMSLEKLREATTELPSNVFRAKGIVYLDAKPEHRVVLQVVGRRARVSLGSEWADAAPETVIVFVGPSGAMNEVEIRQRFDACRSSPRSKLLQPFAAAVEWMRKR